MFDCHRVTVIVRRTGAKIGEPIHRLRDL